MRWILNTWIPASFFVFRLMGERWFAARWICNGQEIVYGGWDSCYIGDIKS